MTFGLRLGYQVHPWGVRIVFRGDYQADLVCYSVHNLTDLVDHALVSQLDDTLKGRRTQQTYGGVAWTLRVRTPTLFVAMVERIVSGQLDGLLDLVKVQEGGERLQGPADLLDVVDGDAQLKSKRGERKKQNE